MKILRLEIQGFKSFADRTVFEFDDAMTAIVGPNGCGKSNVVDALKWVLGDMSPRSLRGRKMEDVIFAGSRLRKPLGLSEVTLVLDNEDGTLPVDVPEVAVTRRLHRSGDSEYLLNREICRLRDIRELFFDTGVGTDGNAIMEQGQIDALLAANPQDRRGIFEEAAGVSRYKHRRREADLKLKRTHENLDRLRDVLDLEEKRLRSLRNQAARARRYQALREEWAKKRTLRAVIRYRNVAGERDALQAKMAVILERETQAADELASLDRQVQDTAKECEAARNDVVALEQAIASAASDVRAARDRVEYTGRHMEQLRERITNAREQTAQDEKRVGELQQEMAGLEEAAQEGVARRKVDEDRVAAAEQELAGFDQEAAQIRDAHDGAKREALNALARIGEARNEETSFRTEIRQAEERLRRLAEQRSALEVRAESIAGESKELYALAASLEEATRTKAAALQAGEETRAHAVQALDAARARRQAANEARASKSARLEVLQRLAAAREGMDEGARLVLARVEDHAPDLDGARDGVLGILADLLEADPARAAELDLLLGHAAGAVVVKETGDALRWIDWLREQGDGERARFLCLDLVEASTTDAAVDQAEVGCTGPLAGLVRAVVSGTALVDDLSAAIARHRAHGGNVVTPSGDRVTASGAILGGRDAPALGLVGRMTEIRTLHEELHALAHQIEAAEAETRDGASAVRDAEEAIRRAREELEQQAEDRQRRGEALARIEKERAHVRQGLELLIAETSELDRLREGSVAEAERSAAHVAELERDRAGHEERAEEAARGYVAIEQRRKEAADRRMELLLALAETKSHAQHAQRRVEIAQSEIESLRARVKAHEEETAALSERVNRAEVESTEAEAEAKAREADRVEAGDKLVAARKRHEALDAQGRGADERRREVAVAHERLRDEMSSFRVRDSEHRTRMESLIEQVRQDQGLDLVSVATEAEPTEAIDLDAMETEVEELRRKLDGIGNVNLNAITELEEVEEHVTFLRTQETDLLEAASGLDKAIKELDTITTERFGEAFQQIRQNFQTTFRKLFGGGRADVMLEDASNLLESGIEIVARPPGKEQRTISLLSGGERTLTATALLFAVFQAKPSPFAILDEVDAALDEANVRRLLGMVREFADRCQFVIITHAKATMEAADLIYGVTMEEPGVSKRVAVRMTEYADSPQTAAAG